MQLTIKDILNDIEGFQERIFAAQTKLNLLPAGYLPYPEHKKRKQQQHQFEDDIRHLKTLRGYAQDAIDENVANNTGCHGHTEGK